MQRNGKKDSKEMIDSKKESEEELNLERIVARRSFNRTISELSDKAEKARIEHMVHRQSLELSQKYMRHPMDVNSRNMTEEMKKEKFEMSIVTEVNEPQQQQQQQQQTPPIIHVSTNQQTEANKKHLTNKDNAKNKSNKSNGKDETNSVDAQHDSFQKQPPPSLDERRSSFDSYASSPSTPLSSSFANPGPILTDAADPPMQDQHHYHHHHHTNDSWSDDAHLIYLPNLPEPQLPISSSDPIQVGSIPSHNDSKDVAKDPN
ncbi:hypothetical protein RFI_15219, partial [Reticulomyxa filosa]